MSASQLYGHAGFSFVNWKPAKDQLRELLESKGLRVNHIRDLPISFGGSRLEAYIEASGLNISDLIASLENHRAAVNINVTIYAGTPDNPAWWESLQLTHPKTKIYTAHDKVNIYRSDNITHPPQVSDVNRTAMKAGAGYDVWAAPLSGSRWICIYDGDADTANPQPGFVLWVSGEDMRAMP